MTIDALLFDKDGTLFDFAATWEVFARAFLLRVTQNDTERATRIGLTIGFDLNTNRFSSDSIVIAATSSEIADVLESSLPEMDHAAILNLMNEEASRTTQVEAVPLAPFLDGLRQQGIKLGVATNDAESPALAHLGAAGVHDKFDFIAGFDSGHGAKPGPGQLLAFAAHVGVDPSRVAMVGDSSHDLQAGRAAGMVTIGVLTGMAGADELSELADVVLPDIGHIPGWLAA